MTDDYLWDPAATPDPEIARLEALLRPLAYKPEPLRAETGALPAAHVRYRRWLAAAAAIVVVVIGVAVARQTPTNAPWQVATREGAPVVRTAEGELSRGALASGGAVETDAKSSARLSVGRIGTVDLGPGSRLRLLDAGASEHRLSLERGTMHATIDAPPRYFLVETASALAVDLGCVYTLSADERGNGMLVVEEGEVEL
ncbi:MAG: FecR family protein, partial [Gemmatimonadota bacterium]|nr:FecR family protein [Gemmatimonadota bacterium]